MSILPGAQFEILLDGTPRSYRDRKEIAMERCRIFSSGEPGRTCGMERSLSSSTERSGAVAA